MCIVQHVEMKSVFTFQPIKRLVCTTVKSAKPAAMFWVFLLRTKNRQLCCMAVKVHIVLRERRVSTTKKKNHSNFDEIFRQSQPSTSEPEPKKFKMSPNMEYTFIGNTFQTWNTFLIGWWFERPIHFPDQFIQFQSTVNRYSTYIQVTENHDLLSLQRRNPVDFRFWSRLCYYCSKWSRPKFNNQRKRNTPSCLAIAVVSKARFLE